MQKIVRNGLLILSALIAVLFSDAQAKYSFKSQEKLLPAELGQVYMGMDIKTFSQKINLDSAEADDRFEELQLEIPFKKGNIEKLALKFTGLTTEQKSAMVKTVKKTINGEYGSYESEVKQISPGGLVVAGQLYEIGIFFKKGFDLGKYAESKYGKPGDVYKQGDEFHFYDMQWTKKTSDGLTWLIRFHKESGVLQLAGRIPGSEWSLD